MRGNLQRTLFQNSIEKMNKDQIKEILIGRGYPEVAAEVVSGELLLVKDELKPLLDGWLGDEVKADYAAHGYTVLQLMTSRGITYPAALLTMDWLLKEPEIAEQAISRRRK